MKGFGFYVHMAYGCSFNYLNCLLLCCLVLYLLSYFLLFLLLCWFIVMIFVKKRKYKICQAFSKLLYHVDGFYALGVMKNRKYLENDQVKWF